MSDFAYTPMQIEALKLLSGNARHIMLFGGSRSGKSFVLCGALAIRALRVPGSRHAIIRKYCNSLRSTIGFDTMPKLLRSRFGKKIKYNFNKSENFFSFPNSSEIWLLGLDDADKADKILGKEFATIYFNECSELDYHSVQTALTRLAQNIPPLVNRAFYDCNPPGKNHWTYRLFIEKNNPADRNKLPYPDDYVCMQINPNANRSNLPAGYIEKVLAALPAAQRKRFLYGEWLNENSDALWQESFITPFRVAHAPELIRIVIGIDPAVTSGEKSDLTGIVAAGISRKGEYYILADCSMKGHPWQWCRKAVELYHALDADLIVGEVNNGGELIASLLQREAPGIPFKGVRASRGKITRAEPVATLYEKGIVHHVGIFPLLEEEMCSYTPDAVKSPDRMDALVWAVTELSATAHSDAFILA